MGLLWWKKQGFSDLQAVIFGSLLTPLKAACEVAKIGTGLNPKSITKLSLFKSKINEYEGFRKAYPGVMCIYRMWKKSIKIQKNEIENSKFPRLIPIPWNTCCKRSKRNNFGVGTKSCVLMIPKVPNFWDSKTIIIIPWSISC